MVNEQLQSVQERVRPSLAPDADVHGKALAMTVLTPLRPGGTLFLRLLFGVLQRFPRLSLPLVRLSFIHFAHWNIVTRIPDNGPPQAKERLNHPYLLFESNFNGRWDDYIEAFAQDLTLQMKLIWGSSFGFPGPLPVRPFEDYVRRNAVTASYYWSAYPGAATTEILSALELKKRFTAFAERVKGMPAPEFKAAYEQFLTDVQRHL
jgi:hypothetical protein